MSKLTQRRDYVGLGTEVKGHIIADQEGCSLLNYADTWHISMEMGSFVGSQMCEDPSSPSGGQKVFRVGLQVSNPTHSPQVKPMR